ncbi:hypothetical protein CHLNCDRAFT_55304 [Chlorella variabilis]|uniref:THO complex subunit 1 n=1 Tax=Chlorella variabilis TaxID=554065 RepID=E1ZSN2_CHLVA|nr:hypothetical protein CHLNCDRAFT_55304 [Chlorella variabilis]EFN51183.1 hypothetical protein CHLNCDRAFT_55304 [Chlorella variabilis]|eukprot:XP_005843285.1 hypothetical protein CHLNCDRAFT_55304 [Chlorella variabilis]
MTVYDEQIARLQALVLDALRQHSQPEAVATQLVRAAFPEAAAAEPPPAFRPLPAAQQEQLANALHAAAGQLLADAKAAGCQVMQYQLGQGREQGAVAELLDAVLWLAAQKPSPLDVGLPAQLLEQITEGASVQDCEGVFAFLDSRTATFKSPAFQEARCKNTLLRTCNMLLKRLSKSANAMLCGRILLFLAKLLPLTERSGVNLGGAFNTDNSTPVEDVQEGATDSEGKPVDAAFYRTFWGLQSYFSNPPAALQVGKWGEVSRDIRRVLEKFRLEKVTVGESAAAGPGAGDGQGSSVKYLSSSRLMGLQLRDATFRRHFLLQCLILMQASLLLHMQLGSLDLRAKVYAELEATPDRGPQFAAAIRHLVRWEDSWAAWKQGSCPPAPLERAAAQPPAGSEDADLTAPAPKRRKLGSDAVFGIRVGTDELDRLWNLAEDNLSALSADDRGGFKTVRQLMEPVVEEMREAAAGEDDGLLMKASRSKLYSWKALRAVARTNLQAFAAAVQKGGDLEVAARVAGKGDATTGQLPGSAGAAADTTAATGAQPDGSAATAAADTAAGGGGDAATAAEEADGEEGAVGGGEGAEEEEEGELPEEGEAEEEEGGEADGSEGGAVAMDAEAVLSE